MGTIEAFSFGQIADASGSIKGSFNITGTTENPSVIGGLVFNEAAFTPTVINSPLFLEDETIALTDAGIGFSNFTVLDSMKNAAVLDGMIYTKYFTDYRFDLRSEEHTTELQSLMRPSYAVCCLKNNNNICITQS